VCGVCVWVCVCGVCVCMGVCVWVCVYACVCWCGAETAMCLGETSVVPSAIFCLSIEACQHFLTPCTNYFYVTHKKKTQPNPSRSSHKTFPGTTYKIGTLFTNFVITNILFTIIWYNTATRLVHTHKRI